MPIDFHAEENRDAYTTRQADPSWSRAIKDIVHIKGKHVLDIGCGGGIYSKALADMGASHVTALDFSQASLAGARENCRAYANISFVQGNALDTGLYAQQYDVILERALIHHLKQEDLPACFTEAFRLLKPAGTLIVQDRTPEDCLLPGSNTHIRGYFFERYPKLIEKEIARRYENKPILQALLHAGFPGVNEQKLWETRARYPDFDALSQDLLARTGRSILYELTDDELQDLVSYIREQLRGQKEIVEQDRWTLWSTVK
ncbi:MAG: class I SAM-dependent methyltransferase [Ktedonobacteraceae bacterium]